MTSGGSAGSDGTFGAPDIEALTNIHRDSMSGNGKFSQEDYARMLMLAKRDEGFASDLALKAKIAKLSRRVIARHDSSTFAEYVLRREDNGKEIRQAPFHDKMHRMVRSNDRVVMWGSPSTGKSLQLAVAWPLWLLGRDQNLHIAIIQATDNLAKKTIRAASAYIDDPMSPGWQPLHEVFPDLKASKRADAVWNTHAITVERTTTARDPSYQACGLFGNILGARLDVIVLDDILTFTNTRSPEQRQKVVDWIITTVLNRLDPERGRIVFMGNAWHPSDAMHVFAEGKLDAEIESGLTTDAKVKKSSWASARFPLRDEHGKTTWPDKWPQHLLDKEYNRIPPGEAARTFDCVASSDATSRFKRAWFAKSKVPRLAGMLEGRVALMRALRPDDDQRAYYCGVDLAFADPEKRGDRCAIGTLAVDSSGKVELASLRSGRWLIDELLGEIVSHHALWEPRYIFVESNAAQRVIGRMLKGELKELGLDFPPDLKRRIVQYETGVVKNHPKWGIEGQGAEMANGVWSIPCGDQGEVHPEIEGWINDLLHYSPSPKVHTGDRAMAIYMAWDGCRRRLGERQLGFIDTSPPPIILSTAEQIPVTPREKPRPGESELDAAIREGAKKQKRLAQLAADMAAARESSAWQELDSLGFD